MPSNKRLRALRNMEKSKFFIIDKRVCLNRINSTTLTNTVSCVARNYSGIPPTDNEQRSSLSPEGKTELS
jgi:hypothetical protein